MIQTITKEKRPANSKPYDLEERTFHFAKDVREYIRKLPKTISNQEDIRQLVRSSGSVGANYIEANESLGKKDFQMRIKISRKEAKESSYWLRLLDNDNNKELKEKNSELLQESRELTAILGAILGKSK